MDTEAISKNLKGAADGLSFMILFTLLWTIIAIVFSETWYYRIPEIVLATAVLVFIFFYLNFNSILKKHKSSLKEEKSDAEEKKDNRFFIIFITEGLAILIVRNVLVNIHLSQYFVSALAFIVGVHFFPLAALFKKKIHNYVGAWITLVSIIGLLMTYFQFGNENYVTAFVGIGCAVGTVLMGSYMIYNGKKYKQLLLESNK